MKGVLIRFRHGLGDCVQFTVVLQHLLKHRPDWEIDVQVVDQGKASIFNGFERVRAIWHDEDRLTGYVQQYDLEWAEAYSIESDGVPATKAEQCLRGVFGIEPAPELCGYIRSSDVSVGARVTEYLRSISDKPLANRRFPVVIIHYQGNTATEHKNLTHELVARLCDHIIALGFVPLILDWDNRSPLPNGVSTHCPNASHQLWKGIGTGDAMTIADLIESSSLFIGIDSGPQKVAFTTTTPMICVWRGLHPIHYFPFAPRRADDGDEVVMTRHLVPNHHVERIRGDPDRGLKLFSHYDSVIYQESGLDDCLMREVQGYLQPRGILPASQFRVTSASLRRLILNYRWTYRRIGLDERQLEFTSSPVGSNFRIGRGASGRERNWNCQDTAQGPVLVVSGEDTGPTFYAFLRDGKFISRWFTCEQCDVELISDRPFFYQQDVNEPLRRRGLDRFFVGIPTYNCYDLCARLIDSIFRSTVLPAVVYVIDNGEGEKHFSFPDRRVSVFRPQRNFGVARSWNLLHRFVAPDPIVILNDDIVLGANCLEELLACGAAAATLDELHAYEAFLLREEVWNTVGEFDERFYPAYFEDNDHARRLNLAGHSFVCPPSLGIAQNGRSNTKSRMSPEGQNALECAVARNGDYYLKKWGGLPGDEVYPVPFSGDPVEAL